MAQSPKMDDTPQAVVARHISFMQAGKSDAAAEDYDQDAVLIVPPGSLPAQKPSPEPGVVVGRPGIRTFLAGLVTKENYPAIKGMVSNLESRPSGVVLMHWTQFKGTSKQIDGLDVFVVKSGQIVFQSITLNPKT